MCPIHDYHCSSTEEVKEVLWLKEEPTICPVCKDAACEFQKLIGASHGRIGGKFGYEKEFRVGKDKRETLNGRHRKMIYGDN